MLFETFLVNSLVPYRSIAGTSAKEEFSDTVKTAPILMVILGLLLLIIGLLYPYGAAKLSWDYNIYVGNTTGAAVVNSVMAFFFANFYYPLYAIALNPLSRSGGNA